MNNIGSVDKFHEPFSRVVKIDMGLLQTTEFGRKTIEIISEACKKRYITCKTVQQYLALTEKNFKLGDCCGQAAAFLIKAAQNFKNSKDVVVNQICFQILEELAKGLLFAIQNRKVESLVEKLYERDRKRIDKLLNTKTDAPTRTFLIKQKLQIRRGLAYWNRIVRKDKNDLYQDGLAAIPKELVKPFTSFSKRIDRIAHQEIAKRTHTKFLGIETLQSKRVSRRLNRLANTITKPIAIFLSISSMNDDDRISHRIVCLLTPKNGPSMLYDSNKGGLEASDAPSLIAYIENKYMKDLFSGTVKFEMYSSK